MTRRIFAPLALLLAFGLLAPAAPTPTPAPPDPIVGKWIFVITGGDNRIELWADGTAKAKNDREEARGRWRFLNNRELERKYEIVWSEGAYVDTVKLSRDGKKIEGKNQKGMRIEGTRAIPTE